MALRVGSGTCFFALAALLAGCANNRDYGRDAGETADKTYTAIEDRQYSERTWVERDRGAGSYTERKYNARPYKDRSWADRDYRSREYREQPRNYRERDPREKEPPDETP